MKYNRNKKGQFTKRTLLPQGIMLAVLLAWLVVSVGAVTLQQTVEAWTTETMEVQDDALELVHIVDTNDRTSAEVAVWYLDKVNELLRAEGVDNYSVILDEMNQYARDTVYLETIINNK